MKDWPAAGMRELVHELYNLSAENRRFLHARLLPAAAPQTLDEARRALKKLLSVSAVFDDRFQHADAKRIVDQYAKAVDDPSSLVDLLLSDMEVSLATFSQVGDFEPMVDHLYASLHRLESLGEKLTIAQRQSFVQRITELSNKWYGKFGYGISDEFAQFANEWRASLWKRK